MRSPLVQLLPLLAALAACGGGAARADSGRGLPLAFGLPRLVAAETYFSRGLVVEAVYQATALSGGLVTGRVVNTGTLTGTPAGLRYQVEPADRLVVVLGATTHEFRVHEAQGNAMASTSAEWLAAPHRLRYTHHLPGAEVRVTSAHDGVTFEARVEGWREQSRRRYELDLTARGRASGVVDPRGSESRAAYDLTGTIRGDGVVLMVKEAHLTDMASFDSVRVLPSQRGMASRWEGTLDNVLVTGGAEYRLAGVRVRTDQSTRGDQGRAGLSLVEGQVLRDGEPFGDCALEAGRAVLRTSGGVLELDLR